MATVAADQAHVDGKLAVSRAPKYTVHEIAAPSGVVVREFVSPAGTVFGVAWTGPTMPDLRQVLGPYFDRYVRLPRTAHARTRVDRTAGPCRSIGGPHAGLLRQGLRA